MEWGGLLGSLFKVGGDVVKEKARIAADNNKTNGEILQRQLEAQNRADAAAAASKNQTLLIGAGAAVLLALVIYHR